MYARQGSNECSQILKSYMRMKATDNVIHKGRSAQLNDIIVHIYHDITHNRITTVYKQGGI